MNKPFPLPFSRLLKHFRKEKRLSQGDLAEEAGLSRNGIGDLERGLRSRPRSDTVDLLIAALGLSPLQAMALRDASRLGEAHAQVSALLTTGEGDEFLLAGREEEQAGLRQALIARDGKFLSFEGEPGMGKSRLLQEAADLAKGLGWRVVVSRCHRGSGQEAYGPLQALVEEWNQASPTPTLEADRVPPGHWADEQSILSRGLRRHLDGVAGASGTLLVLDDLHWAGTDAIRLLRSLLAFQGNPPLVVVCAFHLAEVAIGSPLAHLVAEGERDGWGRRFPLRPLDSGQALELLNARCTGNDALKAQVLGLGRGNPLYLVHYLEFLSSEGTGTAGIPPAVGDSILQQFDYLGRDSQDILSLVVASEQPLNFAVFSDAVLRLGHTEAAGLGAWDEALRHQLAVETAPGWLQCRHDLVRQVLEVRLGTARLGRGHRYLALALEAQAPSPKPEVLARHFEAAGWRAKAAVYWERAGGRALSLLALTEAADAFSRALALVDPVAAPQESLSATFGLLDVLLVQGEYAMAVKVIDARLDALAEVGILEGQARLHGYRLHCRARQVNPAEGLVRARTFLPITASLVPSMALVEFFCHLAYAYYLERQFVEQRNAVARAEDLLSAVADPRADLRVAESRVIWLAVEGRYRESAEESREKVIPAYHAIRDRHRSLMARLNLVSTLLRLGDFAAAQSLLAEARTDPAVQEPRARGFTLLLSLQVDIDTGRWDQADGWVQEARALEAAPGALGFIPEIWLESARLALLRGQVEAAAETFARVGDQGLTISVYARLGAFLLAEHHLFQGRPDLAVVLSESLVEERWSSHPTMDVGRALLALAQVWMGQGNPEEATVAVDRAREAGLRPSLAESLLYRGWMKAMAGNAMEAKVDLEESHGLELLLGRPHQMAKVLAVAKALDDFPGSHGPGSGFTVDYPGRDLLNGRFPSRWSQPPRGH